MAEPSRAPCPDENVVAAFARGELAPAEAADLELHMDACPSCAAMLAELARIFPAAAASSA